jgi:hypothetical protein
VLDPFLGMLEREGERWMRAPGEDLKAAGLPLEA